MIPLLMLFSIDAWTATYELYSGTITEGDYIIFYSNGAMKAGISSNRFTYESVTPSNNKITNPANENLIVWHIAASGTYWTIYNAQNGGKYAAGNNSNNQGALIASITDYAKWTVTGSSTYEFVNKGNKANSKNANLRKNTTYGFACYSTSTGGALSLYKKVASCTVAPTVGSDLTSVSATTTSITATVPISAIGGCNITENGLVYSTSNTTPTVGGTNCTKVTVTACGSTAANKTVEITGLTCGTTYYVRGFATNDGGTSYTGVTTQATSDCAVDHFIDAVWSTSGYTGDGMAKVGDYSASIPSLSDQSEPGGSETRCKQLHYHFAGWVAAADKEDPEGHLVELDGNASNTTYYAVWEKKDGEGSSFDNTAGGDFYIYATVSGTNYYATSISSNKLQKTTNIAEATKFTFTKISNGVYSIYDGSNYLYNTSSSGTNLATRASSFSWTISAGSYGSWRVIGNTRALVYRASTYNYFGAYVTGNINGTEYFDVEIGSAISYTDPITSCCANMVDAPTVSATNIHYNQFTLSWTNVTGADSYTVTCTGGTPGAIQSDGTTRTCTITGLASPNTSYSWSVVATYSGSYCGATPAAGSTTTAQVYAVTYNANGGTVSPLPSTVSYEAGVTVTVAAEPGSTSKSGCTFTGWNTQADGQGTHYAASGSATFTMPSSTVTLYAEWTKKKNYYVDRMHGTNDGHTVTIDDVVYNCYLREGAGYTVPTISDNTSGATTCHNEHDHLLFWVVSTSVNDDGTLKGSYTEVTPGSSKTATTDGTIYYAIWGKLAD